MAEIADARAGAARPVVRAEHDLVIGIEIAVGWIDVQLGEGDRPILPAHRIGHREEVEEQQRLALVEPVITDLELVVEDAELGELAHHGRASDAHWRPAGRRRHRADRAGAS